MTGLFTARKMTVTAVMAAVATMLMYLKFPVPMFMPTFIKMDFSELPGLIASFSLGPIHGVIVCLLKNLANMLLTGTDTGGVGELSNFLLGCCFVVPAGLIYRRMNSRRGAATGAGVGAITMALMSIPLNYYLIYPIYTAFMPMDAIIGMYRAINPNIDNLMQALIWFNAPFTFVKGLGSAIICFAIYKRISSLIKGK